MFEKEEARAILDRKEEVTSEDFICPQTKLYTTISYCQSFLEEIDLEHVECKNKGCKFLSSCQQYINQKNKKDS